MLVVLDTNLVVSMLLGTRGVRPVYDAFQTGAIQPVLTEATLDELREVVRRPHLNISPDNRAEFLDVLKRGAVWVANPVVVLDRADPGDYAVHRFLK